MIHPFLQELVLIDMSLDWSQIDVLAPALVYVEQLHLVRCQCNKICSEYAISKDYFKNLKFINLEQNGIESWDELVGFRTLPVLKRLTVSKNKLKDIYYKPGFNDLYMISIEDNLISDWHAIDALNEFKQIKVLRCGGNPVLEKHGLISRNLLVARVQFLNNLNGSEVDTGERKNAEIFYLKKCYEDYIREHKITHKLDMADPQLQQFMLNTHPRWYELAEQYSFSPDMVSLKPEGTNIASTSAKVKLVSEQSGKTLDKKLLLNMTVTDLKAMCAKLFKIEVIKQKLMY